VCCFWYVLQDFFSANKELALLPLHYCCSMSADLTCEFNGGPKVQTN
jgi:hypothetical protein